MTAIFEEGVAHRTEHAPDEWGEAAPARPLATFLGLFSIGLGLAEALAPRRVGEAIGVRHPNLLRAYGLREIATGVGILASRRPAALLWGRLAGDVLDLATLAAAYAQDRSDRTRVMLATAAVTGVAVLDGLCAMAHEGDPR